MKNEKGAALVELALALTILLTIVFGIFEFGRALFIANTLNNAARDGARRAVVSPLPLDQAALISKIRENAPLSPDERAKMDVKIESDPATISTGTAITVTTTLPYVITTPLIATAIGKKTISLTGKASMRYE